MKKWGDTFNNDLELIQAEASSIDANTGEEVTYGKIFNESVRCGIWLRKNGLRSNDVVFTCCHNRIDSCIPILGTFYNGATFAIGHKGIFPQRTRYLFKLLKPKFIFTEEEELKLFVEIAKEENLNVKIVTFTKVSDNFFLKDILNESTSNEVNEFFSKPPSNPNNDCIMSLTSGTTGDSKILSHSYKAIMEGLLVFNSNEDKKNGVSLICLPLYWMAALRVMLSEILNFTTTIVVSEVNHNLDEAFQLIEKYKVTKVRFSLGIMYRIFKWKKLETYDTSTLKILTFSGVKLPPEMIQILMKVVKNGVVEQTYGATEMSIPMCRGIMNKIDINSCGSLYPNMSMKVIDVKSSENLGPKEAGEICFKSPYLMKGYFKNPAATAEAIDSEGWYHTGDLGYFDENGLVFFQGRVKGCTVLSNGNIVPLWCFERALFCNAEVLETCVFSNGDDSLGTFKIFAFVALLPNAQITENELVEIAQNCSDVKLPITVKIVDSIPKTSNGKFQIDVSVFLTISTIFCFGLLFLLQKHSSLIFALEYTAILNFPTIFFSINIFLKRRQLYILYPFFRK
ncbi:4-coumarate--CoA ligase 3-like [Leptopilina heterotoma]|uniref:4-coumarate--CoA ligase 3-like n=1 Tax=Leptopilina heterotoma TaxID=63436 RepID=UPI001CA917A4|nr:4-coumarate--CoA ligase 3-like [Leptopilina heterotoma]